MSVRAKSSPLKRSGLVLDGCQGIGEAVAEIQSGRMISLAETAPCLARGRKMFHGHRRQPDSDFLEIPIQFPTRLRATATFQDHGRFEGVRDGHAAIHGPGDRALVARRVRFATEDGEQRRTVHDHFGKPRSS